MIGQSLYFSNHQFSYNCLLININNIQILFGNHFFFGGGGGGAFPLAGGGGGGALPLGGGGGGVFPVAFPGGGGVFPGGGGVFPGGGGVFPGGGVDFPAGADFPGALAGEAAVLAAGFLGSALVCPFLASLAG